MTEGAKANAAATDSTSSWSVISLLKGLWNRLTTINTTLGTPFQAGGSIGNTSFAATQATASNLNATVVGTGTFATQAAQSGTWNINNVAGTVSLPTGAATASNQTGGSQKTQIVDGSGNVIGATSNALNVAITSGGGSGGTSSSFAASFPATGTAIGVKNGSNMVNLTADGSSNLNVDLATALPAGSNAIGSITNTSFAATQGTAANLNATVVGTGTFATQAAQSGTWNITNVSGTVSLPTGAATAAKQPAIGTAGSASADVLSVQGVASMTALKVDGSAVTQPVSGTVAASQSGTWTVQPGNTANSTPWLTTDSGTSATGSAAPSKAEYVGANSSGNLTGIIQADSSAAINVSTATTTQLVALTSGKKIYVTQINLIAGGTGNVTLEYGTGSTCGTGTTVLTGAYNLTAQAGLAVGSGLGPVLVVPASNALCILTSAAVQISGFVSYTQF